ncbi:hypothetical protein BGZ65_004133 [Modicella reniformis]|uniref:Glutathione S-transferase n=1 Tax=Modicella reniformis TaxID=1440133 RepID=A0A9P6IYU0_9FUNG|nr:hypothetical protein BGZ65_004133 [Modicella reniformis]
MVQYHEYFDPAQAAAFNELSTKRDSTFELTYWGFHGLGKVENVIITDETWGSKKPLAPFGLVPTFKETSSNGKTVIQIAESDAIERYLAKKFGLFGDNAFEETVINTFLSHTNSAITDLFARYYHYSKEDRESKKEAVINATALPWLQHHERHLTANGSNGHYVGDKLSLADLKASYVIKALLPIIGEDTVTEAKTPALWRLKTTIDKIPTLAAWRATKEYRAFDDLNRELLGY